LRADEYVRINVYPTKQGWMLAVLRSRVGRPYPRLVGKPRYVPLRTRHQTLSEALAEASDALAVMSQDEDIGDNDAERHGTP
jgi:hypothetical protein